MAFLHNTHHPAWNTVPGKSGHAVPVPEPCVTGATTAGGWIYSIFDDPDKQQAAWDYVSWMLSPVMRAMCGNRRITHRRSVFDDPIFASELFQVFGRQLEAHPRNRDPSSPLFKMSLALPSRKY